MKPNSAGLWREKNTKKLVFMECGHYFHNIGRYTQVDKPPGGGEESIVSETLLIVDRTKTHVSFLPHGEWELAEFPSDRAIPPLSNEELIA